MPDWKGMIGAASRLPWRRPVLTAGLGAAAGGLTGRSLASDERKPQATLTGAGIGAAASLVHPGVRRAVGNWLRRQAFPYHGRAPKSFGGSAEEYLKSIQSHKMRHPTGKAPLMERIWERTRRAAGKAPKELKAEDPMANVIRRHRAGLTSFPGAYRAIRKDPKEFARQWWQQVGKQEAKWAPLWVAPTLMTARGQSPEEKRKQWGESVGGTLGWAAVSGMPASVWLPATYAAGHIGKVLASGHSPEPARVRAVRKKRKGRKTT